MFNLRQLMELEAERLATEAEAELTAQRAAEQRRADGNRTAREARLAEEHAAAERARATQLEARRIEQEHELSLQRAQFESQANARIELERLAVERERIALEHARALQREPSVRPGLRAAAVLASLLAALLGGGALHATLFAPRPSAVAIRPADARPATAKSGPLQAAPTVREAVPSLPVTSAAPGTRAVPRRAQRAPMRSRVEVRRRPPATELDGIDFSSDDPIAM
jgi:hypothetical protein